MLGWLEVLIGEFNPFNSGKRPYNQKQIKMDSVSVETFLEYMTRLTQHVEKIISNFLPHTFVIVFDGRFSGSFTI